MGKEALDNLVQIGKLALLEAMLRVAAVVEERLTKLGPPPS